MKKTFLLLLCALSFTSVYAADTVWVREPQTPILIDKTDNILYEIRVVANAGDVFNSLELKLGKDVDLKHVESIKLYFAGRDAHTNKGMRYSSGNYFSLGSNMNPRKASPSYSVLQSEVKRFRSNVVSLVSGQKMHEGVHFFWVSLQMKKNAPVAGYFSSSIDNIIVNREYTEIDYKYKSDRRLMGVALRASGDDGVVSYRIPGLITTDKGTLIGTYDIRHNNGADLQEYVDVAIHRSTDKGQTWEPMQNIMKYGEYGGYPKAQNGVGDPAILFDTKNNKVYVIAVWAHGIGLGRMWSNSRDGMEIDRTPQLVISESSDDGKTWSEPRNITTQVKDPKWNFMLQGPGCGITMEDGTLVFPTQYIDENRMPYSCLIYSKDAGKTWNRHNAPRENTTEAQLVELEQGTLMLNMRDNRGGSRAVAITKDMGKTWTEHQSSRSALREPVCMASIIKIKAKDNVTGKEMLVFSNPNTTDGRYNMTVKISFDAGNTWNESDQLLIDSDWSAGYSCLTQIDAETIGILYECSGAPLAFQSIKIMDVVNNNNNNK